VTVSASHLVLVGLPGVGKTTVGKLLATRLCRNFCDFDDAIVDNIGKSVSKIFEEDGEAAFRAAEVAVSDAWAKQPPAVLSPGGGWIMNREAVAHLRPTARIIYLRVNPSEAVQRMGANVRQRPLLAKGDPEAALIALFEARKPYYEAIADVSIDTSGAAPETIVEHVAAALGWEPEGRVE
jgi:shikimate kinase